MPFCTNCGGAVGDQHKFCAHCGVAAQQPPPAVTGHPAVRPALRKVDAGIDTSAPDDVSARVREISFARSGSTLLSDPPAPALPPDSTFRGIPPLAVAAAIVFLLALSGLTGYRWFSRQTPRSASAATDATEASLAAPGPANPTGPPGTEGLIADRTWTLVAEATREVSEGDQALGTSDQKVATIAPGGSLAVTLRAGEYLYNGEGPDIEIHGPEGERTRYTIFARADTAGSWVRFDVNSVGFRNGMVAHDMGHHGLERARQIMIKNESGATLAIDALTPLHLQAEAHDDDHAGVPAKPRVRQ